MKRIEEFLNQLKELDISLSYQNGVLKYDAPKGKMTPELVAAIRERKEQIIQFLTADVKQANDIVGFERITRSGSLPLSYAQQRLWFFDKLVDDTSFYNICGGLRVKGNLNRQALQQSIDLMVKRHENLRTNFVGNETPVQLIHPQREVAIQHVDLRRLKKEERAGEAERIAVQAGNESFNLASDPLFRVILMEIDLDESVLVIIFHHIISDNWSLRIFIKELLEFYQVYSQNRTPNVEELPYQYADYSHWQRKFLSDQVIDKQLSFWKNYLAGAPQLLELPTDRPRPPVQTFHGRTSSLELPAELSGELLAYSRGQGTTLFITLLTALQCLFYRYSGQNDIVIGAPFANRRRTEIQNVMGFFVNMLAFRSDLSNNPIFNDLLRTVKEDSYNIYENQDLPFDRLVEELEAGRDLSRNPIFQAVFQIQKKPDEISEIAGLTISPYKVNNGKVRFDFEIIAWEAPDKIRFDIEFNGDLFDDQTIQRMMSHFHNLLAGVIRNPNQRVAELPLLTSREQRQILHEWNQNQAPYPKDKYVHQLFEEIAASRPNAVAVVYEGDQRTYRELNEQSNQLARYLQWYQGNSQLKVGIYTERSIQMIINILAALKAGGAYLPLDPAYPMERVNGILNDAEAAVVLTNSALAGNLTDYHGQVICLDQEWPKIRKEKTTNILRAEVNLENLAYIIYTSGSTGTPKGVLIPHQGLLNLIFWHVKAFQVTGADRATQLAGLSFDASVWEIWPYLTTGAALYLTPPVIVASPENLRNWLIEQKISICFIPTPLAEELLSLEWPQKVDLRYMLTGGDKLHKYPQEWIPFILVNNYGPTENTVVTTSGIVKNNGTTVLPTIGRPIFNTDVYILDPYLNPVPIGVKGELYIGGASLSFGYLNRPELNREKFIKNPFAETGARLYRTGDVVRYLPSGEIEFMGRIDNQVKIRGFRIELGEIESVLSKHKLIKEVSVIVREDTPGNKQIVAYYVNKDRNESIGAELRNYMKEKLPSYMVPAAFIQLEQFPLTPNGKIDLKKLPKPQNDQVSTEQFVPPRTEMEKAIIDIWKDILKIEKVGLNDNFFDLGGHSLIITQLQNRLREKLKLEISVIDLFNFPTVGSFANYIATRFGPKHDRDDQEPSVSFQPHERSKNHDIAIIGMAGRFPGANSINEFWDNLCRGVESISRFSDEELLDSGVDPRILSNPGYVKSRGIVADIGLFDADFFGFTQREAEVLDPQQRIFLECAWAALESAGYDPENYPGKISVFGGASISTYFMKNVIVNPEIMAAVGGYAALISNDKDFLATRVAYKLNLKGPAVNINTACSTSLVSVHLACQNLLNYESDMALAGGVSIYVPHKEGYLYQEGGINSPDGHCRAFDADAKGMVSGSGAGVLILKRLEDAIREHDTIYAVIKGSAINNDGNLKVGFTAPGIEGQADVINCAQVTAGIDPATITYIEAHGTGTALGDPIEIAALRKVYEKKTDRQGICAIGSLKTNIGHLDAAAGVASLIKASLLLYHKKLVPSLHYTRPNPQIDFEHSPFYVNTEFKDWVSSDFPRRAGVSSFGIGGTNAHAILEEAPASKVEPAARNRQLLLFSAKTSQALEQLTHNVITYLEKHPEVNLADAAYTLQIGRKRFQTRRYVICKDRGAMDTPALEYSPSVELNKDRISSETSRAAFLFSGESSDGFKFERELYHTEPIFQSEVDLCMECLKNRFQLGDIQPALLTESGHSQALSLPNRRLLTFIMQYSLGRLLIKWGVSPQAVMGRGVGEYIAACFAGILTLEEALRLVISGAKLATEDLSKEAFRSNRTEYLTVLDGIALKEGKIPYLSSHSGQWLTPEEEAQRSYWSWLTEKPDRFEEALASLRAKSEWVWLEMGADARSSASLQPLTENQKGAILSLVTSGAETQESLLGALGNLWLAGIELDWERFYGAEKRNRISLPAYPLERKRYWIDPPKIKKETRPNPPGSHPETEMEEKMKELWQAVFGVESIQMNDNFFEIGGDSLMAVNLLSRIKLEFSVDLRINDFFKDPTITGLLTFLRSKVNPSTPKTGDQTSIQADIRLELDRIPALDPAVQKKLPETILLTGATGFLGAHLLAEILTQTTAEVYCLARAEDKAAVKKRVIENLQYYHLWDKKYSKRIIGVPGDLSKELLGLTPNEFENLSRQIAVIYHNGALVNHLYPYSALRSTNVLGAKEILKMAASYRLKPLHYVSTLAVFGNGQHLENRLIKEDSPLSEFESLNFGYAQSKWAAEKILEQARLQGIPVSIYRAGNISGDTTYGISTFGDTFWRMIVGCFQLGVSPKLDQETPLEITPVDFVAKAIVYLALRPDSRNKNFHVMNPSEVNMTEFMSWVGAEILKDIKVVPLNQWQEEIGILEKSPDNPLYPILPLMRELSLPENRVTIDHYNCSEGLKDSGIQSPTIDRQLIIKYFRYFREEGFLKNVL